MHIILAPRRMAGIHIHCQASWLLARRAEALAALAVRVCAQTSNGPETPAELPRDFRKNEGH